MEIKKYDSFINEGKISDYKFGCVMLQLEIPNWEKILSSINKEDVYKIHDESLFENPKYDVLKFDVISPLLNKINKKLTKELPYTSDFPDYHAHCTIAYIKKRRR